VRVDLTMPLDERTPIYPGHPEFELVKLTSFVTHGKEISKLVMGTHMGTHIDAPRHFIENGATVDSIPLDVLIGPARLYDFSSEKAGVTASALRWASVRAAPFDRVLFRFDGDKRLGTFDYYKQQPWLAEDAAHWLVDRGCKLVGLDTPMPDAWDNIGHMPVHKILLGAGVVIVEYMVNLKSIPTETFDLTVLPLNIVGGDGAPARCVATVQ
jgi:arylformamidase